jgi:hypothetical protein
MSYKKLDIKTKESKFHLDQIKIKNQFIDKWISQREIYYNFIKQMRE